MKTLFIPAKIENKLTSEEIEKISKKLPKNIAIAYSIQYIDTALKLREILSKSHKITKMSQVLGCSRIKFPKETGAVLLLSSGRFHAVSLALESNLPIYILEDKEIKKISEKETETLKKRKKASYLKFLNADNTGILISAKPGQENLERALILKKSLKDKKSYLFLSNDFNKSEFENFPDIQSWVNTACPRLDFDFSIINIAELRED